MRDYLRSIVERRAPGLASGYRALRDELRAGREHPVRTPAGFLLAGDASMQTGTFEPVETTMLTRWLHAGDVFVDVGANVGFYSCLARQIGCRVVAVEPLADNLRYLYRNLRANGWDDVEVWPVGLAERSGLQVLYGGQTGASLVPGWAGMSAAHHRTISVTALDLLLGSRFPAQRLTIKIDVEGAEHGVLKGAAATLDRTPRPLWLVEIVRDLHYPGGNPHLAATFELFMRRGYGVYAAGNPCTRVSDAGVRGWIGGAPAPDTYSWVFAGSDYDGEP
jgi:FkbM family methyltransferase